jgi:hypothetical protein
MACAECRELSTHTFRSPDDLIHALRLAAEEMNRGVLCRVGEGVLPQTAEADALDSVLASGALPDVVRYRFRCEVCGDHFSLTGDTSHGLGGWTREGEHEDRKERRDGK